MSSGNAFTNPSSGKIDQQRKILEELERRKKQLNQQSTTGLVSSNNSLGNSNDLTMSSVPTAGNEQMLNNNQRAAIENANKSSFGFFISQASNFGNLILPVIPRLNHTNQS